MNINVRCFYSKKLHKYIPFKDLKIDQRVICEDGNNYYIKSMVTFSSFYYMIKLSSGDNIKMPDIFKMKTDEGFKIPEKDDLVLSTNGHLYLCLKSTRSLTKSIFYDIVIEKPIVLQGGFIVQTGGHHA
jgi:hypothetical protein